MNNIPVIVMQMLESLNSPHTPEYQRANYAVTIETIRKACEKALDTFYASQRKKK